MSIKYLCYDCVHILKMSGFDAINEVGRKSCARCGDNDDCLVVVDAEECDRIMNAIQQES